MELAHKGLHRGLDVPVSDEQPGGVDVFRVVDQMLLARVRSRSTSKRSDRSQLGALNLHI